MTICKYKKTVWLTSGDIYNCRTHEYKYAHSKLYRHRSRVVCFRLNMFFSKTLIFHFKHEFLLIIP